MNCNITIDKQDANGDCPIHLAVKCNGADADFEKTVKVLENLRLAHFYFSRMHEIFFQFCRRHPSIIEAKVIDSSHDPLTLVGKSAMHLALEDGRHERALIILELSNSK